MDQLTAFLLEHWVLSGAFVILVVLLIFNEFRHLSFGVSSVSNQQLVDLLNHSGATIIDVRKGPLYDAGHILGALNIPSETLPNRIGNLTKYKSKPVVVVCHAGVESPKMGRLLKANGFTELYYLAGGMELWKSEGMPIAKK